VAQINQLSVTSGSVSLPNSGSVAIFSNIEDNGNLYIKSSAGTVTPVGNTSGGGGSGSSGSSGTSGTGVSGSSGTSGTQGIAGSSGTSGTAGAPGATGSSGTSGTQGVAGSSGTSGTQGVAGSSGTSGTQGVAGSSGSSGTAGTSGTGITSGTSGATGAPGSSGTSGAAGSPGAAGSSGTSGTGGGGGGGTATQYNTVSRYQAYISGDIEVYLVSSATVNTGLTWSRSGTTLTITHTSHGRSNGDRVIVRNANQDNFTGTVTVVDLNSFTVTTTDTGTTSGTAAAYSLGFTVGTPTASALTITAPTGGDVQLLSVLFATGARGGSTTLAVTVPQSATNGAGANTTGQNSFYPIVRVQTISTGAVQGATLTLNTSAPFNVFNFGSMNATLSNLVRLDF
jgi:hypothetical protein